MKRSFIIAINCGTLEDEGPTPRGYPPDVALKQIDMAGRNEKVYTLSRRIIPGLMAVTVPHIRGRVQDP